MGEFFFFALWGFISGGTQIFGKKLFQRIRGSKKGVGGGGFGFGKLIFPPHFFLLLGNMSPPQFFFFFQFYPVFLGGEKRALNPGKKLGALRKVWAFIILVFLVRFLAFFGLNIFFLSYRFFPIFFLCVGLLDVFCKLARGIFLKKGGLGAKTKKTRAPRGE